MVDRGRLGHFNELWARVELCEVFCRWNLGLIWAGVNMGEMRVVFCRILSNCVGDCRTVRFTPARESGMALFGGNGFVRAAVRV